MSFVDYLREYDIISELGINHANDVRRRSSNTVDKRYRSLENVLLLICALKEEELVNYYNDYLRSDEYVSTSKYEKDINLFKVLTMNEQLELETIVLKIDTKLRKITLGTISRNENHIVRAKTIINKNFSSYSVEVKRVFEVPYLQWIKYGFKLQGSDYRAIELDVSVDEKIKTVFRVAVERGATDISIESQQDGTVVKFTIDKDWHIFDNVKFDKEETKNVTNWIITNSRIAQTLAESPTVDCPLPTLGYVDTHRGRVNKLNTYYGVSINIRILPNNPEFIDLARLNYTNHIHEFVQYLTSARSGLVLIVGPTNSGKNTTVFSIISEVLRKHNYKAISLEQPIEYLVPGVNQISAETDEDYAKIARALVRQSPDIVYLSEIRDAQTMEVGLNISNTGKFVLSTLHVSRASQILYRAEDLCGYDISNKLTSELIGVINQVLVPRACPRCLVEIDIEDIDPSYAEVLSEVGYSGAIYENTKVIENGKVCPVCMGLGTKGIVPVAEYIHFGNSLKKKLRMAKSLEEKETILEDVMKATNNSLLEDGLRNMSAKKVNISTLINKAILDREF